MSLQDDVTEAWKQAMKARDPKKDALASIRTELKNAAINARSGGDQSTELADDEAVAEKFVHKNAYGPYENYLGAEHEDKNPRKTAAAQNRQGAYPEARATAITIRG